MNLRTKRSYSFLELILPLFLFGYFFTSPGESLMRIFTPLLEFVEPVVPGEIFP